MQLFINLSCLLIFKIYKSVMFFLSLSFLPSLLFSLSPMLFSENFSRKIVYVGGQRIRIPDLALAGFIFMILEKLFTFSKPLFPHLWNGHTHTCLGHITMRVKCQYVSKISHCRYELVHTAVVSSETSVIYKRTQGYLECDTLYPTEYLGILHSTCTADFEVLLT